ncbi:MAG: UPF0158 family protein [Myxococcales bacterium]|nr:UPF0158 family protein [Myxococcales bacterium]
MKANNSESGEIREVPIAWETLEDAFENNAPEVHSYINLVSGDVIRVVDGIADPAVHARIANDASYMRIDPVSSREQYRWMEHFIATVTEPELRQRLVTAIDGKGAFRRFKDVLMAYPVDRERWFSFRSERLRTAMEAWLEAHGIRGVERSKWPVPTPEQVKVQTRDPERGKARRGRAEAAEATRGRCRELIDLLPVRELDMAAEFLEFLRSRRPMPRAQARPAPARGEGAHEGAQVGDNDNDYDDNGAPDDGDDCD